MASRILTNSGYEIQQALSTGYVTLVVRGTGLVRDTGVQYISGAKYFYDTITFYSGVNVSGDLVPSGDIAGNLIPKADDLYDLGSVLKEWRNGYFDGILRADQIHSDGDLYVSGSGYNYGNFTVGRDFIVNNVASNLGPKTDNTYDLGSSTGEWKDIYIDGMAKIDTLTVDENASIASGLSIGGNQVVSGTFSARNSTVSGDLTVTGKISLGNGLVVTGTSIVTQYHRASSYMTTGSGQFGKMFITGTGIPTTSTSAGVAGQIVWGSGYLYVCTGTNLWGRTHLTGWT